MVGIEPSRDSKSNQDAEILVDRIIHSVGRPVVFLFGAALSMKPSVEYAGVPSVHFVVRRLRGELAHVHSPEFQSALEMVESRGASEDYSAAYRVGFATLLKWRGQDAVNRLIRSLVLEAHLPLEDGRRARVLASHPGQEHGECASLIKSVDGWQTLSPALSSLGELLVGVPDRFGPVLTTNFDPLIEVAVRRAGGHVRSTILARDGSMDQHRGQGAHVVYLHGNWLDSDSLHTDIQLAKPRPALEGTLRRLLERSFLVVLGYGGWDDVLMRSLQQVALDPGAYPDIAWGCFGNTDSRIQEQLAPAGERVQFYEKINLHHVLPALKESMLKEAVPRRIEYAKSDEVRRSRSQSIADCLEGAYLRREELAVAGQSTAEVESEILELRRRQRHGPILHSGEFLGDGRYRLIEIVGRGGFATVWKAFDRKSGGFVAVKVLHGQFAQDAHRRERLFRGARKMSELNHPNIVRVIESECEDQGFFYYVMDYMVGGDLYRGVLEGRIDLPRALDCVEAVAGALELAHQRKFVHRDVKPQNILLGDDGIPALTDFDLVQAGDTTGGTKTGALGTLLYAAPEQNEDARNVDARADVFSLGMTAAFCVYGKKMPRTAVYERDRFLEQLPCGGQVREVLKTAVSLSPEDRFETIGAFRRALLQARRAEVSPQSSGAEGQDGIPASNWRKGQTFRQGSGLLSLDAVKVEGGQHGYADWNASDEGESVEALDSYELEELGFESEVSSKSVVKSGPKSVVRTAPWIPGAVGVGRSVRATTFEAEVGSGAAKVESSVQYFPAGGPSSEKGRARGDTTTVNGSGISDQTYTSPLRSGISVATENGVNVDNVARSVAERIRMSPWMPRRPALFAVPLLTWIAVACIIYWDVWFLLDDEEDAPNDVEVNGIVADAANSDTGRDGATQGEDNEGVVAVDEVGAGASGGPGSGTSGWQGVGEVVRERTPVENPFVLVEAPESHVFLGLSRDDLPRRFGLPRVCFYSTPRVDFYIQEHEVTWVEFEDWLDEQSEHFDVPEHVPEDRQARAMFPVTGVSYRVAQRYCEGLGGSLPTEGQWELAARGPRVGEFRDGQGDGVSSGATLREVKSAGDDVVSGSTGMMYDFFGNAREWTIGRLELDCCDGRLADRAGSGEGVIRGYPQRGDAGVVLEQAPDYYPTYRQGACGPSGRGGLANLCADLEEVGFRCVSKGDGERGSWKTHPCIGRRKGEWDGRSFDLSVTYPGSDGECGVMRERWAGGSVKSSLRECEFGDHRTFSAKFGVRGNVRRVRCVAGSLFVDGAELE